MPGGGSSVAAFARRHRLAAHDPRAALVLGLIGAGAVAAGIASNGGGAPPSRLATPTPTPTTTRARCLRAIAAQPPPHLLGRRSSSRRASRELPGAGDERLDGRGALRPRRHDRVAHRERHEGAHLRRRALGARTRLPHADDRREGRRAGLGRARRRRRRDSLPHVERRPRPCTRARRTSTTSPRRCEAWAADPSNPPLTKLILDASYFSGDEWERAGRQGARGRLHVEHRRAHGRRRPRQPRYQHLVAQRRPGRPGRPGVRGRTRRHRHDRARHRARRRAQLGEVQSPTVAQLVDKALVVSDNTVAEMLARLVAIETGAGNPSPRSTRACCRASRPTASTPLASRSSTVPASRRQRACRPRT